MAMAQDPIFGKVVMRRLREARYNENSNEDNIRYLGKRIEWGGLEANRLL